MRRAAPLLLTLLFAFGMPWVGPHAVAGTLQIKGGAPVVLDGDTFEVDVNGNGKIEPPGERVRLLFVDTPELGESHKGKDLTFGIPAKDFLAAALTRRPLLLTTFGDTPHDRYGRLLAVVYAGGRKVNLELVREGHSYFDTRFQFPEEEEYDKYVEAEASAFKAKKGIWSSLVSRRKYLQRLAREGRTPAAAGNPHFYSGRSSTEAFFPAERKGKFVQVEGPLTKRTLVRKGGSVLLFKGPPGRRSLQVYVSPRVARKVAVEHWPIGARVELDGFVAPYKGTAQLRLHYGRVIP